MVLIGYGLLSGGAVAVALAVAVAMSFLCRVVSCVGYPMSSTIRKALWCSLLLFMLPSATAAPERPASLGFDPAKRIPLLTDGNYTEWSWRVAAAFVAMGVSVKILTMSHASADLSESLLINVDDQDAVKEAKEAFRLARLAVSLHQQGDGDLDDKKAAVKDAKEALAEARAQAREDLAADGQVQDPFDGLTESQLNQCFQLVVRTLSPDLDFLIMNSVPSQLAKVWSDIRDYFLVNTRGVRNALKVAFFSMEMQPRQKFAEFKAKIEFNARQLNSMDASRALISEDDKVTVLMNGVRKYHDEVFRTTLDVLDQSTDSFGFEDMYKRMVPTAKRAESAMSSSVPSETGLAVRAQSLSYQRNRRQAPDVSRSSFTRPKNEAFNGVTIDCPEHSVKE